MNTADYFSLSSRVNSYLHVAVYIAQYEGYLYPFAEELLHNKIGHWVCSQALIFCASSMFYLYNDASYIYFSLLLSYLFVSNYLLRLEMIYDLGHCYLGCIASSSLVKFNNLFHFEVLGWVSVGLPRIIRCKMLIALGTT